MVVGLRAYHGRYLHRVLLAGVQLEYVQLDPCNPIDGVVFITQSPNLHMFGRPQRAVLKVLVVELAIYYGHL
ncbi:hypothetical protein FKM82_017276 [Ascaphus truei]